MPQDNTPDMTADTQADAITQGGLDAATLAKSVTLTLTIGNLAQIQGCCAAYAMAVGALGGSDEVRDQANEAVELTTAALMQVLASAGVSLADGAQDATPVAAE